FFHVISSGGVLVATSERTPAGVFKAIESARVELLPVSPTFLNLCLLTKEYLNYDTSSLRKISYGTEPMPQSTLDAVKKAFPGIVLQQTYGLTEVGIMSSKSREDGSLWVKIGGQGFDTKIVNNRLWVKAQSAMIGYLNSPSPFDDEGWLNTHDIVELDGEFIRFLGRDSEIINVGGEKLFPAEVVNLLISLDNIKDATVRGEQNNLMGQIVVATVNLIESETARDVKRRIRSALKGKVAEYKIPHKIIIADTDQFNERFKRMRLTDMEKVPT
ncbi:MAG: long-chain fatty acid--CoA ligase, partial [Nitrospina sp.]|nr:long-chain fatty acid--CoA ligase [Nitrospina sp.]